MSANGRSNEHHEQRLAEAMAWRVRLTEDPAQAQGLDSWVAQDPAHADAWREVQDLWGLLGKHATAPEAIAARCAALDRARRHHRRRWRDRRLPGKAIAASLMFIVVVAGLVGGAFWRLGQPDVYRTTLGERRVVTLADGSAVSLDAASEVRVKYSERGRDLTLVRGQASFDVARDPLRPFAVQAGDRRVIATGTAFNIDMLGPQVLITLIEGHVLVLDTHPASNVAKAEPLELRVGQRLIAMPQRPAEVQRVDVDRTIAWQQGQLIFDNEPLTAVAARVSRYTSKQVMVADDGAANLRLSGVFNTGDLQSFLATVTAYLPVQARQLQDGRIELRQRPAAKQ